MSAIAAGLVVLHGNRLEALRDAVVSWIGQHPLGPLEEEVFLVQSNGAAEWLKMSLARAGGVCAATRVELPARFLWRAYRQMLGRAAVPATSPFDRGALAWRLMRVLPAQRRAPGFEPIARFLAGAAGAPAIDDVERRWQLAQRLADLFDQYQVHRADWLKAWAAGHDTLPDAARGAIPVPEDQRWQPALWRVLLGELDESARRGIRPRVHRAFVERALSDAAPAGALPRRVVLFGTSHLPAQTLEALAALGTRAQVLLAIPNPCRYHWSDILEGRELLRPARARHASRAGRALADVPLEAMHAHAHPLLAAWGRQGRDFMRELDAWDEAAAARQRPELPRIDLFDDGPGDTLLAQLQADIRDLVPPSEQPAREVAASDRSIVFHVAHSAQREVEVLHDQLLSLLAHPPGGRPLAPRDIVVMVPDIEVFAPAIRAVFGQLPRDDARFIPFEIADLRNRGHNPLVVALEWLLRAPSQRFRATEVRDLLDVPGIARRFGLAPADLPGLVGWIEGAGVRWGLDGEQRAGLGLAACGDANSWAFGLRRMLLGYAMGQVGVAAADGGAGDDAPAATWHDIEPHAEVGGLEAAAVGSLADLLRVLEDWWRQARTPATPRDWAVRGRALLEALVEPADERERLTLAALRQALSDALEAGEAAGFDEPVPLAVLREAWLAGVDAPGGGGRFLAGGVTFCTLMPLRAVPFEVVALLGMNDGDYPRASARSDFDLMALPQRQRPGDRSRRDDDRYLLLEAVLSARRVLHVSWTGRSVRDNTPQPPSVLVSQLRDHLSAHWHDAGGGDAVATRTTEHPLQPFSRRYFEAGGLQTQAMEWRAAHGAGVPGRAEPGDASDTAASAASAASSAVEPVTVTLQRLARFLQNPVREFFRVRLDADLRLPEVVAQDDEPFTLDGLDRYQLVEELVRTAAAPEDHAPRAADAATMPGVTDIGADDPWADTLFAEPPARAPAPPPEQEARARIRRRLAALRREGRLPMAALGRRVEAELEAVAWPMVQALREQQAAFPEVTAAVPIRRERPGIVLDDWLDGLSSGDAGIAWIHPTASAILETKSGSSGGRGAPRLRADKLVLDWLRALAAAVRDVPMQGRLVGRDAVAVLPAIEPAQAEVLLDAALDACAAGLRAPLPWPLATAMAAVEGPQKARTAYEGGSFRDGEVDRDPHLQRWFPDFDALVADGRFAAGVAALHAPFHAWLRARDASAVRHPQLPASDAEGGE